MYTHMRIFAEAPPGRAPTRPSSGRPRRRVRYGVSAKVTSIGVCIYVYVCVYIYIYIYVALYVNTQTTTSVRVRVRVRVHPGGLNERNRYASGKSFVAGRGLQVKYIWFLTDISQMPVWVRYSG